MASKILSIQKIPNWLQHKWQKVNQWFRQNLTEDFEFKMPRKIQNYDFSSQKLVKIDYFSKFCNFNFATKIQYIFWYFFGWIIFQFRRKNSNMLKLNFCTKIWFFSLFFGSDKIEDGIQNFVYTKETKSHKSQIGSNISGKR